LQAAHLLLPAGDAALPSNKPQWSMDMKRSSIITAVSFATLALTIPAMAAVMVGGAQMYPSKNIIENAVHSKVHTTLVSAVKAAGLVQTLEGPGPFTVFAPTNRAFDKLPKGAVANLMKPSNEAELKTVLTYHVVPGRYTTQDLRDRIRDGDGKAMLKTVEGQDLTLTERGRQIRVEDDKGDVAEITTPDVIQSNGIIQVINAVLMPNS
jgi:uncharacterized surface protein with fasciclin (FAS1) repeats